MGIEGVCFALTEVVLFFCGEVVEKNFFGGFVAGPVGNAGGCEGKEGRHEALVVSTYTVRPVDRLEDVYLEEAALQQFICQFFFSRYRVSSKQTKGKPRNAFSFVPPPFLQSDPCQLPRLVMWGPPFDSDWIRNRWEMISVGTYRIAEKASAKNPAVPATATSNCCS